MYSMPKLTFHYSFLRQLKAQTDELGSALRPTQMDRMNVHHLHAKYRSLVGQLTLVRNPRWIMYVIHTHTHI